MMILEICAGVKIGFLTQEISVSLIRVNRAAPCCAALQFTYRETRGLLLDQESGP